MIPTARTLTLRFLHDLFHQEKKVDTLFQDRQFLGLDERDRRLVTELVYGVLRNRSRLDFYILQLSRRPLRRLDEAILWILRIAIYQIEFLRIPDHAAVHEAVGLCHQVRKSSAAGFVNAMLHTFLRARPALPSGSSAEALSIQLSYPQWLTERYLQRYGPGLTRALLERNNRPPVPFFWINPFKVEFHCFCKLLQMEGINYEVYPGLPNCLVIHSSGFSQHTLYRQGYGFFMDLASQEVTYLVEAKDYRRLGDFCAATGGKSFLLASRKVPQGKLYCCDSNRLRLRQMARRARLYQIPDLHLVNADLCLPSPFRIPFDFVLLDVPCSGLGTLRSNPDIRWRIQEVDLTRFHSKQLSILQAAFSSLGSGGKLLYSTCSTEPEENELVIEEFLDSESKARIVQPFYRSYPQNHAGECFFAALIGHV